MEGSIIDLERFQGYPEAESGFAWLIAPASQGPDLARMGFQLLSRANNHAVDWGAEGLLMTDAILHANGLATAGTGASLAGARAPGYVDGKVARSSLVSWATTFERNAPAADALGVSRARPGASTLGLTQIALVRQEQFDALKAIRDAQPAEWRPGFLMEFDARMGFVTLFGQHYKVHPDPAADPAVHFELDSQSWREILRQVKQAKQTSDFTVVASHTHEPANWATRPPTFLPRIAREAIAEGADLVCGHGPHQLRGIEVVEGKPVFYSLGNFAFMDNTQMVVVRDEWERRIWRLVKDAPAAFDPTAWTEAEFMEWTRIAGVFGDDIWFESVVAVVEYDGAGRMRRIDLHPIELGNPGRDSLRGIPRLAGPEHGLRILDRLARLSAPLGTEIRLDRAKGIGIIEAR
jgi:poly-gamma-glutamate synthesis protein (capsule biosynthesis protein)